MGLLKTRRIGNTDNREIPTADEASKVYRDVVGFLEPEAGMSEHSIAMDEKLNRGTFGTFLGAMVGRLGHSLSPKEVDYFRGVWNDVNDWQGPEGKGS